MFDTRRQAQSQSTQTKATLLLVSALTVLSSMTLSPTLPGIRAHFHTAPNASILVPLVLTLHAFFIVIGSPLAGYLLDRIGRKPLLIGAALLYGLAGSAGFLINDLWLLLLSRALLGLATAGTFTSASTLIADYYTGQTRTQITAWQTAAMNFGGVTALLLSGLLSDISWHLPFLIYLLGLALVPLIIVTVVEPEKKTVPSSLQSADSPPRISLGMLSGIYAIMFACMLLFFFVPVQLPFYLQGSLQTNGIQNGIALAAANLCTGMVGLFYSRFSPHVQRFHLLALAFAGLAIGLLIIGTVHAYPLAVVGALLTGTVAGIVLPTTSLWIMATTPLAARGRALGGLTSALFLGQFLSSFVSQPLSQQVGLATAFVSAGAIALVLALLFLLLRWQTTQAKESSRRDVSASHDA